MDSLTVRSNKFWSAYIFPIAIFLIVFPWFAFRDQLTTAIPAVVVGCYSLFLGIKNLSAYVSIENKTLTSKYITQGSVDLSTLAKVTQGNFFEGFGGSIKLIDNSGKSAVITPRLYKKQDIIHVLEAVQSYFPSESSVTSSSARRVLKYYGIRIN